MNHTPSPTTTETNQYTIHASALLAYAERAPAFATYLYERIAAHITPHTPHSDVAPLTVSPHLMPATDSIAQARALWLMEYCIAHPQSHATALLSTWYHQQPQAVVLGVVGIAIIGPTLGLIKRSKHEQSFLHLIAPASLWRDSAEALAVSQQISTTFIAEALREAGGEVARLLPDIADWCFYDQKTLFYHPTTLEMDEVIQRLQAEHIPHVTYTGETGDTIVAVSPAVSDTLFAELDVIKHS